MMKKLLKILIIAWNKLHGIQAPPKEFVKWCQQDREDPKIKLSLQKHYSERDKSIQNFERLCDEYIDQINKYISIGEHISANLDDINQPLPAKTYKIKNAAPTDKTNIEVLHYSGRYDTGLVIEGISVKDFILSGQNLTKPVMIRKCKIARLQMSPKGQAKVAIEDTSIGTLIIHPHSVKYLDMKGGCILDIDCPPPEEQNPFIGSVTLSPRVFLPRESKKYLIQGPQPYRNVRSHLRSLENSQMANLFHSAELAVERESDTRINRVLSRLYQCFSDFGSSALRPVLWLLGVFVVSAVIIFLSNGAMPAFTETNYYIGWRSVLLQKDICGQFVRAIHLAFQPIFNPLGIFSIRTYLVPSNGWIVTLLLIQGFFSVIWIALTIFAIRRRFKMQ